ncbi:MAG: tail fiber domain-containing protein [Candidatus Heimdallarchaeota archaeon]|nr:tail fiber domain-containing protein [Candidatus Heimdallarchaeota archaeon]
MGGLSKPTQQVGQSQLGLPEQINYGGQTLQGLGPQANQAYSQFLQPYDAEQFQGLFQQAFVDPAMQNFEQQTMPAVQQRMIGANAGSSSALNQALASSAADVSTNIGSQMGQFYQGQQQNKLGALGQLNQLTGTRLVDPLIQEGYDPTGALIGLTGQLGQGTLEAIGPHLPAIMSALGMAMSSREYKENIREYTSGLEEIKSLEVKRYDFKEKYGERKNCLGLIAEDVPDEIYVDNDNGHKGVDVYGLCSMLVEAVQQLTKKVEEMEEYNASSS